MEHQPAAPGDLAGFPPGVQGILQPGPAGRRTVLLQRHDRRAADLRQRRDRVFRQEVQRANRGQHHQLPEHAQHLGHLRAELVHARVPPDRAGGGLHLHAGDAVQLRAAGGVRQIRAGQRAIAPAHDLGRPVPDHSVRAGQVADHEQEPRLGASHRHSQAPVRQPDHGDVRRHVPADPAGRFEGRHLRSVRRRGSRLRRPGLRPPARGKPRPEVLRLAREQHRPLPRVQPAQPGRQRRHGQAGGAAGH